MSEKINFLYKKFNRVPSTSTDISSNLLETFDVSGKNIVYNDELYTEDLPSTLPTLNIIFSYSNSTTVTKTTSGSTSSINMSGVSNSSLVSSNGLKEDIWQAFRENKITSVESNTTSNIVKINDLVTSYVSDTNSILSSPSYFHPIMEDAIPNTIKNQIYEITVKGKNSSNQIIFLSNQNKGDWIVQSDCGVIQFFDQSSTFIDVSNNTYNLFDNTSNSSSASLFNKVKSPLVSFFRYIGFKGSPFIRTSNVVFKLPQTDGNLNTYLRTDGNGNLSFQAVSGGGGGGSSYWSANGGNIYFNSGRVGIGSNSPVSMLHVKVSTTYDGINITNENNTPVFKMAIDSDDSGYIRCYNNTTGGNAGTNGVFFSAKPSTDNYINNGGDFGIGTATPTEKLEVNGNLKLDNGSTTGNQQGAVIKFDNSYGKTGPNKIILHGTSYGFGIQSSSLTYHSGSNHIFRYGSSWDGTTNGDNGTIGMTLNSGNLGIGTSSPSYKLDVSGDINFTGTLRQNGSAFSGGSSQWTTVNTNEIHYSSGNVGIGTNNPAGILHLSSGTSGNCNLILEADTDNNNESDNPNILFKQDGGQHHAEIGLGDNELILNNSVSGGGGIVFKTGTQNNALHTSTEKMRINSSGNVGIGNTNPSYKLDVGGDINFTGTLRQNGSVFSGSSQWTTSSSNIYYNSGNVGIGTNVPSALLQIHKQFTSSGIYPAGNLKFSTNNSSSSWDMGEIEAYVASNNGGTSNYPGGLAFKTKNADNSTTSACTTKMVLDANGNVGIGTNSPARKLHLYSSAAHGGGTLQLESANTMMYLGTNDGTDAYMWIETDDDLKIGTNNTERIRVKNSGNVGIGNTNPSYKLDVSGNGYFSGTLAVNSNLGIGTISPNSAFEISKSFVNDNDTSAMISFTNTYNTASWKWQTGSTMISSNAIYAIRGGSNNYANLNNLLTIVGTGNIGIGTGNTLPAAKLEVAGNIKLSGSLVTSSVTLSQTVLGYLNGVTSNIQTQIDNLNSGLSQWTTTGNNIYYTTGSVGIGTNNPDNKLTISGGALQLSPYSNGTTKFAIYSESDLLQINPRNSSGGYNNIIGLNLKSDGNVGIGNTNPSYKLDVSGDIYLSGSLIVGSNTLTQTELGYLDGVNSNIQTQIDNINNSGASRWSLNGNKVYYNTDNVGIGTSDPSYKLDVSGDINFTGTLRQNGSTFSSGSSQWTTVNTNEIHYSSGNVGIGTNNPAGILHLSSGTSGNCNLILEADTDNNNESDNPNIIFAQDGGLHTAEVGLGNNQLILSNSVSTNGGIVFKTGTQNHALHTSTEKMRINSSGNVGIGTSNPSEVLDVTGNIKLSGSLKTASVELTQTELGYLDGITSSIQTQINTKQSTLSSSNRLSATNIGDNGNVSNTEYGYLSGVTSDIQTQLNAKQNSISTSNRLSATLIGANGNISDAEYGYLDGLTGNIQNQINTLTNNHSTTFNVTVASKTSTHPYYNNGSSLGYYIDGLESPVVQFKVGKTYRFNQNDNTNANHPFRFYNDAAKSSSYSSGVSTNGTAGSSGAYVEIQITTSTPTKLYYQCSAHGYMGNYGAVEIAVDNLTMVEVGYLDGVTSSIQTQLNGKQSTLSSSNRLSATNVGANGNVSDTEYGYLDGVTSSIQPQLNNINNELAITTGDKNTFNVVVASKSSSHPYYGSGSSSGYYIDGAESPFIKFQVGKTYRFNQNDGTNGSHPILFYNDAAKSSQYTTGVTTSGTAGNSAAYVEIQITNTTPTKLYYQCANHGYMGNYGAVEIADYNLSTSNIGLWNVSSSDIYYNSGNVGIGTTSPNEKLEINGRLRINGSQSSPGIWLYGNNYENDTSNVFFGRGGNSFDGIGFWFSDWQHVFLNNGNVGIGTTNPSQTLDVSGGIKVGGIGTSTGLTMDNMFYLRRNSNGASYSSYDHHAFYTNSTTGAETGSERMRITSNGAVGIGTTTPESYAALAVRTFKWTNRGGDSWVGTISGSSISGGGNTTNQNYSIHASNTIYANQYHVASDSRIKKNIQDVNDDSALEMLRLIKPKTYQYIDEQRRGNSTVYGFISQEIKEIIPQSVNYTKEFVPNIYEIGEVIQDENNIFNIIKFTNFNTQNLLYDASNNLHSLLEIVDKDDNIIEIQIIEIIDEKKIKISINLADLVAEKDSKYYIFVSGQHIDDFNSLKKDAIWTIATAALQEVDRQLQAEKAKTAALESQMADILQRLQTLENK